MKKTQRPGTARDVARSLGRKTPTMPAVPDIVATQEAHNKRQRGIDGLQNFVSGLGTLRDKGASTTYGFTLPLTYYQLDAMYRSSWSAGKIVDIPADDMTREGWATSWDGREDAEGGSEQIEQAERDYAVVSKVNSAIKWGRLYGGGAIIIGIKGQDFSKPLVLNTVKKGGLEMLHVVDRNEIQPVGMLDMDMKSPNFGYPLFYRLTDSAANVPSIHWTRIVMFHGRILPRNVWKANGYWHDSVLQGCETAIKNYDTAMATANSLMQEAKLDILLQEGMADKLSTEDGEADLLARAQLAFTMKSTCQTLLLDKDSEEYQSKQVSFSGIKDINGDYRDDLCGAADIPATRLFGQSPGGLNSTGDSDIRNYYDKIRSAQINSLLACLNRIYAVLVRSVLGRMPDHFAIEFNPLWQESSGTKATTAKTQADTDKAYFDMGVLNEGAIARELKNRGEYKTMEDADVKMAEELAKELAQDPLAEVPGKGIARGGQAAGAAPGAPAQIEGQPNQSEKNPASKEPAPMDVAAAA